MLEAFSARRPRLTLTELAEATGLNLAAVQRCTHTLQALGYLQRGEHKEFSLGIRVLSLGYSCLQGSELRKMAEEHLQRFAEQTEATVSLSVLDGNNVLLLYRNEMQSVFKLNLQPGSKLPTYCTSMGKVLLATLPDAELKRRIGRMRLQPITPYTITDPDQLFKEVLAVRERGVGESDQEAPLALYSVAVPLLDQSQQVVAAVNVSLAVGEDGKQSKRQLQQGLVEQGRHLSSLLGYEGPYPRITVSSE